MRDNFKKLDKKGRIMTAVIIFAMALAGLGLLYYYGTTGRLKLACPVYTFLGIYCPGCGSGRACLALMYGEWYRAFRYNPLLCMLLPWIGLYYGSVVIQWIVSGQERLSAKIPEWIPLTIFIILLIYGWIRNLDIYPFYLLAPTKL